MLAHEGLGGEKEEKGLGRQAALLTALLASLAALLSYGITATQNRALILKNEAVLVMLTSTTLHIRQHDRHRDELMKQQIVLDKQARTLSKRSDQLMGFHDHYAQALVAVEIGVAVASVAALTRRRWLLRMAEGSAVIALILGAWGLLT